MTTTVTTTPRHPVASFVARMRDELSDLAETPLWSMSNDETRQTLVEMARLLAQVGSLELKVAARADRNRVGEPSGATSAAVWWANQTRMTQREAARKMKLAKALDNHEPVGGALAAGDVLLDQAQTITESVDALPDTVQPEVRTQARDHLLGAAKHHDAKALRVQGRRILEVVAPEIGEAEEARQLAKEEAEAEAKARLSMHDDGHGTTYGRFAIRTGEADMLRKALNALAKTAGHGFDPHGLGLAFMDYIRRYPADKLPAAGGASATIVVTMTFETLMGGLKAAQLDTGTPISPGLARKLACEAGVIPVVLGGRSQVLDVGRKRRFHTKAQRIALAVRDRGCAAMGCERPGSWCHAHHLIPWSDGGGTSVQNGVLLCSRHHTLAHHHDYELTHRPGGKIAFTRRE